MSRRREDLWLRFPSARSIEETGLDSSSPPFHRGNNALGPDAARRNMFGGNGGPSGSDNRRKKLGSRSFRSSGGFRLHDPKSDEPSRRRGRRGQGKSAGKRWEEDHQDVDEDVELERLGEEATVMNDEVATVSRTINVRSLPSQVSREYVEAGGDSLSTLPNMVLTPRKSGRSSFGADQNDDFSSVNPVTSPSYSCNELHDLTPEKSEAPPPRLESYEGTPVQPEAPKLEARNRWRRLRHTVVFASRIKNAPADLLEEKRVEEMNEGAGGVGAAAFEGSKTGSQPRLKGRKGMEGLIVRQDKGLISFIQDFYVACLKMPIGYFLVGVFLAPVALGLLFTPLYFLNAEGLTFDESMGEQGFIGSLGSVKEKCFAVLSVFLYSLSLSTTFGGSPVNAVSPYCLLVANVNTLMAQFLFVFLSGAVFARMSQPSHPIRCSKKAIVHRDDYLPASAGGVDEKLRVLAIRLVLSGPPPCELVDAKICLTFRIFVMLPSGSMFCSTQDLELVRPEVSYLRYGLMVRHIIDKKSPVYGHTLESLIEGDASFSLTVMGLERASMQPIFHLEDYFAYDGDIVWDGDYMDFIHINGSGQRVLDHAKIDLIKTFKAAGHVSTALARMKRDVSERRAEAKDEAKELENPVKKTTSPWEGIRNRKLWSLSTSFTRACDSG